MFRLFIQQYPPYSTNDWTDDGHGNNDDDWLDDGHDVDWIGDGHEPTDFSSIRHQVRQGERER